ncbi:MAG: cytochrome-c oxidase, cbb3-type subunit III [Proteobacteria bacterium]|nr:cytochrome-c oxidase, cbb3-type subunit III [Pseudomonadota bacterium]
MANKHIDEATGTETVGHEWDGIEELNTPLPRWWLLTFIACVIWALVYVVLYPAVPMPGGATQGTMGWTSRGQLAAETKAAEADRKVVVDQLNATAIENLPANPDLMKKAIAGGKAAFRVHCAACHGAGAAGSVGYPNLNDDDWLWGGDLKTLETTITHGIRYPGDAQTRQSLMPSFGRDGILKADQVADVAAYVRSLSKLEGPSAATGRGQALFAANCVACHGADGKGNRTLGAPNLTDAIWLYGSSSEQVQGSITVAHAGVMPAWGGKLDGATIKMLTAYVHSLGGGEASPAAAPAAAPAKP